eukprot:2522812-Alexandrium_andersonii.AAC.1
MPFALPGGARMRGPAHWWQGPTTAFATLPVGAWRRTSRRPSRPRYPSPRSDCARSGYWCRLCCGRPIGPQLDSCPSALDTPPRAAPPIPATTA